MSAFVSKVAPALGNLLIATAKSVIRSAIKASLTAITICTLVFIIILMLLF